MQLDPQGKVSLATGDADVFQAIRIILETTPGERKMRPEFGCRAKFLLFEPINAATQTLMQEYVKTALDRWEPRIVVKDVAASTNSDYPGAWFVNIKYEIKATHDERSIVHPFYIEDEEPVI